MGIAAAALASNAAAQTRNPVRAQPRDQAATAFYDSFNDQIGRVRPELQPEVRRFYELNGWRPVWTPERMQALNTVVARADRHGLAGADFFDMVGLHSDPASADMRTTEAVMAYGRVLSEGRVRPETVEDLWEMQKNRDDLAEGGL